MLTALAMAPIFQQQKDRQATQRGTRPTLAALFINIETAPSRRNLCLAQFDLDRAVTGRLIQSNQ
ncbi:hypothetical protein [Bradyrhizobium sp. ARR65]|uniref:hypothetical protein n=1 Tax=Bradyrhizobium sp. ARR65 TaxID=1040989 RepID=UPI0004675620|nr:hypothetical protein [Bradyrhizobium sp. ARR65]